LNSQLTDGDVDEMEHLLGLAETLSGVYSTSAQFFLNTKDLVVLGETFGTAWGSGLDLSGSKTNNKVSNEGIFGFSGTVRDHCSPSTLLSKKMGIDGLGNGTDLVYFQEETVAGLLLNSGSNTLGVGDSQVVTDNLNWGCSGDSGPGLPVILVKGILWKQLGIP